MYFVCTLYTTTTQVQGLNARLPVLTAQSDLVDRYRFADALTLYQAILTFNDPGEEGFGKHWGKRRKCW